MSDAERDKAAMRMLEILRSLKPKAAPASDEIKAWWDNTGLPTLKAQMLSELHRNDTIPPRLVGFMKNGDMGIIDISKATGGHWGSQRSKDATAFVHKVAALTPGTLASVFCSEAWSLRAQTHEELDRNYEKYPNLGDHPDRIEVLMFQMLHYEPETNSMMQLSTMIEILKVLGEPRRRSMWAGTKLADKADTTDPLFGEGRMTGRFVFREGDLDEKKE